MLCPSHEVIRLVYGRRFRVYDEESRDPQYVYVSVLTAINTYYHRSLQLLCASLCEIPHFSLQVKLQVKGLFTLS